MDVRMYCPRCGNVGRPRRFLRGSASLQVVLWLALLLPGAIYTVWRLTTRWEGCPRCRATMRPTHAHRRPHRRVDRADPGYARPSATAFS